ncbi:MAG: AAA family ATPase [Opitutaceae bacterium]
MILHAIELTHVGPFRATVRLGPFSPGLNLLCAPNEAGKSTSLRAAARALFDKHTTKGEELKSLQPAGTDLAPRVVVEFETHAGRYRIEKTFLQSPRSLLQQWHGAVWQPIAEADAADQRLQDLLHSSLPGRGATKPEHWGFLGFLWARQGEPCEWPRLEDEAVGQQIRARLARVDLDPVIEQLRARLATVADAIVTGSGQPKAGGPLRLAEDELGAIEAELTTLRTTRANLDSAHQRHQRALATVAQLEKEHAEREVQTKALAEQALAAERLRGELETRQVEFAAAQEKLNAVASDVALLAQRHTEIAQTSDALAKAEESAKAAEARVTAARARLDQQQAARPQHESLLSTLRTELHRLQNLLRLRQLTVDAKLLEKQLAKADQASAHFAGLVASKAKLPAITPAKVRKLEELTDQVRTQKAQLQALGLTVELRPERVSSAEVHDGRTHYQQSLPASEVTRLHSPQSLDLTLAGWGCVTIRSGAQEAQNLAQELAESEARLKTTLEETETPSLDAARETLARRKELEGQIKAAESIRAELLGEYETLEALREAATSAGSRVNALIATLVPVAAELERSSSELEADEAQHGEAIPAAEKTLKAFDKALAQSRTEERDATEVLQKLMSDAGEHRTRLRTLESQAADLSARYPEGVEKSKARAQVEFTQTEARVMATKADLPPDFEKLPERNKRAATALQQLANELQVVRSDRDNARGALETLGGQGIYSRETELEEKKGEATLRRDAARTKGWAARVAHNLIEHRKQAATRAVLTPLEQRLTAAFAELTGDHAREVFLDERLQIAGIGRTRAESHPFDLLSQGAREQLLLCLRIAVAQELATAEPQVLILDDVLVNTDSVRQERVLDVLSSLSSNFQIILLTCHADRYRGAGQAITINPAAVIQ